MIWRKKAVYLRRSAPRPAIRDRWRGLAGYWQACVVLLHVCPVGQFDLPVSRHRGVPPHCMLPMSQAGTGVQLAPATHALHVPARQTRVGFVPQTVASALNDVGVQTAVPVLHETAAVATHGLAEVHVAPALHAAQTPALVQTLPAPHVVPGALNVWSLQMGAPVEQSIVAVAAQALLEVQAAPWLQAVHTAEALHTPATPPVVHAVPTGFAP